MVDTARAILDGHIVLSRELAQQGIYPAIDVNQSVSRLMNDIVDETQQNNAQKLRKYIRENMEAEVTKFKENPEGEEEEEEDEGKEDQSDQEEEEPTREVNTTIVDAR